MSIKGYHLDKQIMGYNYSSVVDSNDNYDHHILGKMDVQIIGT
jgi:hypothetical protein